MTRTSSDLEAVQAAVAGRYVVERELGRGGMGVVFLARDVALERPVAIKLLPPDLASDDAMRERFVREARTAARLAHPNIVPIHSVEERDGLVFFVMGFVEGETLTRRVERSGPLNARDGARIIQEVAWALAYAHSVGVVHRDVKPDNVLLDRNTGRALLTDFGIAHVADARELTMAGQILGTAQYVSPEQAAGGALDGRSDLYSLGVTAFFALSGRLPFESATLLGMLGMHLTQPAPPIASVREGLPPRLAAAIDRCLLKDPAQRFATGEELADAISEATGARTEVAPPVRAFLRDRTRTGYEVTAYAAAGYYLYMFADIDLSTLATPLLPLMLYSGIRLLASGRQLLDAGFGVHDVRQAMLSDIAALPEKARGPKGREFGPAAMWVTGIGVTLIGAVAFASGFSGAHAEQGGDVTGSGFMSSLLLGLVVVGAAVGALFYGLYRAHRRLAPAFRPRNRPMSWDSLWGGRFGDWFFRVAATGGKRQSSRVSAQAPTEALAAQAVEQLLAQLPSGAPRMDSARAVLARLQRHAAALRAREEQLAAAAAQAGVPVAGASAREGSAVLERRSQVAAEIEQERAAVAMRRQSVVEAIENIRLQLLRLQAGLATPDDLTADLREAERIEREISGVLATVAMK